MRWNKFAHAGSRTALVLCALLFAAGSARQLPQETQPAAEINQAHPSATLFVMIDAGHGGDDNGAVLSDKLVEKDLTLALARRLKAELQEKGIVARLSRDSDVTLSLEQRAETANEQHAALYVALHAGMPGRGVRVYSPANVSPGVAAAGRFLPWDNAQANYLSRSQALATAVAGALAKKNLAVSTLSTPLRPLNNINAPAIAVELAINPADLPDIVGQKFQTVVASGIAAEISQQRSQWEKQP